MSQWIETGISLLLVRLGLAHLQRARRWSGPRGRTRRKCPIYCAVVVVVLYGSFVGWHTRLFLHVRNSRAWHGVVLEVEIADAPWAAFTARTNMYCDHSCLLRLSEVRKSHMLLAFLESPY